jgi:hypothetical protein
MQQRGGFSTTRWRHDLGPEGSVSLLMDDNERQDDPATRPVTRFVLLNTFQIITEESTLHPDGGTAEDQKDAFCPGWMKTHVMNDLTSCDHIDLFYSKHLLHNTLLFSLRRHNTPLLFCPAFLLCTSTFLFALWALRGCVKIPFSHSHVTPCTYHFPIPIASAWFTSFSLE